MLDRLKLQKAHFNSGPNDVQLKAESAESARAETKELYYLFRRIIYPISNAFQRESNNLPSDPNCQLRTSRKVRVNF